MALVLLGSPDAGGASDDDVRAGDQAMASGHVNAAVSHWRRALSDAEAQAGRGATAQRIDLHLRLAGAMHALGRMRQAVAHLDIAVDRAEALMERSRLAQTLIARGGLLTVTRRLDAALRDLERARQLVESADTPALRIAFTSNLAQLKSENGLKNEALALLRHAIDVADKSDRKQDAIKTRCNLAALLVEESRRNDAVAAINDTRQQVDQLNPSREKALALLTLAALLHRMADSDNPDLLRAAFDAAQAAQTIANNLKDASTESLALGSLGALYESAGQLDHAITMTDRAIARSTVIDRSDVTWRWHWQRGRLLNKSGDTGGAVNAYRQAVRSADGLHNDLVLGVGGDGSRQPFRQRVGPMFYELADLLLTAADASDDPRLAGELTREAMAVVERLKAAELEDYFRDECVRLAQAQQRGVETVDIGTAVVYLVPLNDQLRIILATQAGLTRHRVAVRREQLVATVRQFRHQLEDRTSHDYLAAAQQLHRWLIDPLAESLNKQSIDTLVFVPDGALRTVPMAALHDGESFLIERFALAITPGLALLDPHPLQRGDARVLLGGLSEPRGRFPALPHVPRELDAIAQRFASTVLLNDAFKRERIQESFTERAYGVVHVASHGHFGSNADDTYILTHDGRLNLDQLEQLIRPSGFRGQPVELLALSACQTAAGDDRAALGLAGIAVKAGARSAMATLWHVNDRVSTDLVTSFYNHLHSDPTLSKAKALQRAQVEALRDVNYRHPCFWSSYLVIGNWL